jgi:hypothetical protein
MLEINTYLFIYELLNTVKVKYLYTHFTERFFAHNTEAVQDSEIEDSYCRKDW